MGGGGRKVYAAHKGNDKTPSFLISGQKPDAAGMRFVYENSRKRTERFVIRIMVAILNVNRRPQDFHSHFLWWAWHEISPSCFLSQRKFDRKMKKKKLLFCVFFCLPCPAVPINFNSSPVGKIKISDMSRVISDRMARGHEPRKNLCCKISKKKQKNEALMLKEIFVHSWC